MMTGHHGWGYGRTTVGTDPSQPPIHWDSPLTLPTPARDLHQALSLQARAGPFSHPAPRARPTRRVRALAPRHLAQSARGSPVRPRRQQATRGQARPAFSSAQPLTTQLAGTWGRTLTPHPPAGVLHQRVEVAQGSWGRAERSAARCMCRERARLVCSDLPGAGLRMGRARCSPAGFARRSVQAFESAGM